MGVQLATVLPARHAAAAVAAVERRDEQVVDSGLERHARHQHPVALRYSRRVRISGAPPVREASKSTAVLQYSYVEQLEQRAASTGRGTTLDTMCKVVLYS